MGKNTRKVANQDPFLLAPCFLEYYMDFSISRLLVFQKTRGRTSILLAFLPDSVIENGLSSSAVGWSLEVCECMFGSEAGLVSAAFETPAT